MNNVVTIKLYVTLETYEKQMQDTKSDNKVIQTNCEKQTITTTA